MKNYAPVRIWLYTVCFMIFAMAVIGAITRLTESGLSIVEWKPVTGALPPLSESAWLHEFDLYKQSPEFKARHYWMELDDFKSIFFWEWLHRLWGRAIGLCFALPLLWFAVRRQIPQGYGFKLCNLFVLGGAQGLLGWWMVKSGLVDRPDVSHFRLAAHLGLALLLFSLIWWTALGLRDPEKHPPVLLKKGLIMHGRGALALLALTICWGAFTAGLDAGKIYNTWPLMNGSFTPPETFSAASILEQHAWVQFTHRWLAFATGLAIFVFALRSRNRALLAMAIIQVGLGIATLMTQVMIPIAALHQAGAMILLALLLKALRESKPIQQEN